MAWDAELDQLMTRAKSILDDDAIDAAIERALALGMRQVHPPGEYPEDDYLKVELRRLLTEH